MISMKVEIGKIKLMGTKNFNFFIINDLGLEGNYDQKLITDLMCSMSEKYEPKFVVLNGDIHHYNPPMTDFEHIWMNDFERMYGQFVKENEIPWYPTLGNHEYKGDTQAVLKFYDNQKFVTKDIQNRYYSKEIITGNQKFLLLFLDTTPMIKYYRNNRDMFPDVYKQSKDEQISWLEQTLMEHNISHKIMAFGHHPIYAYDDLHTNSNDIEEAYLSLFNEYDVQAYVCGHVHNFQHINKSKNFCYVDFVINSSCSYTRPPKNIEGTKFCCEGTGFTICSLSEKKIEFQFINKLGTPFKNIII